MTNDMLHYACLSGYIFYLISVHEQFYFTGFYGRISQQCVCACMCACMCACVCVREGKTEVDKYLQ